MLFLLCVGSGVISSCQATDVSFLNREDVANVFIGFEEVKSRSISVNYRNCCDFDCTTEQTRQVDSTEAEIDVTLSLLDTCYNNDVIVNVTDDGDDCGGTSFRIPSMQPTG